MNRPHFTRTDTHELYVMKVMSYYKIGISVNAKRRIHDIGRGLPVYPKTIKIWHIENALEVEQFLHKKYAEFRVNGEWFKLPKADILEIKACYDPMSLIGDAK